SACHAPPPDFTPLFQPADENDCATCHQADFDQAHAGSGFPTTCLTCHNTEDWDDAEIDHAELAEGFALLGAHEALPCAACHAPPPGFDPLFNPASDQDCFTCHQDDYQQQHAGSGFPVQCLACHTPETWEGTVFDHGAVADGFALVGAHEALDCSACHGPPPAFVPLFNPDGQDDCFTCHQDDYQQQHAGSGFPTNCLACHGTDDWGDATVDHAALSGGFALVGAHDALDCSACHGPPPDLDPLFNPANEDDCVACHQPDYDDAHAGTGFPTTCLTCHNTDDWEDADFDHAGFSGGFDLIGAHDGLPCLACHNPPPDFSPIWNPTDEQDCFTCHQDDYQQQHAADGFPYECTVCHSIQTWQGATFDHGAAAGGFQLVGAHDALPCTACHAPPPDFSPLFNPDGQDDCLTCHQGDFQAAHGGQGYPTTCLSCHNTDDWEDADFDHDADYFPIFSGKHKDEWTTCQACHTDPNDFTVFTCLTCHGQQETAQEHEDVPGYVYESNACYSCHPDGED
ncbi:MAG: hypothetical protein R3247_10055, partial [Rhodothermales bacterium]|nr:hypothetical protein [Rhodothermales bacterium]